MPDSLLHRRLTLGPRRESDDPWRGIQPRYERIVMRGPRHFELVTKLPSGEPIAVRLAPFQAGHRG